MTGRAVLVLLGLFLAACGDGDRAPGGGRVPDGLYDSTWTTATTCAVDVPDQVLLDHGNMSLWHVCPSGLLTFEAQADFELAGAAIVVPAMPLYDCAGRVAGAAASWRIEPGSTIDITLSTSACAAAYVVEIAAVTP